jgi:hypothetical protein
MIAMLPDPNFRILGIFSIALIWLGLLFLIKHWPGDKSMSLSLRAGRTTGGQFYYFVLFFISVPMFYLFVTHWFIPALDLPPLYASLTTIGMVGQLIAAAFPAVRGQKEKVHNIGAYVMAFTLIPLTALLVISNAPMAIKVLAAIGSLYMATTIVLSIVSKLIKPRYLYFQTAYIATFHLMIVLAIFSITT